MEYYHIHRVNRFKCNKVKVEIWGKSLNNILTTVEDIRIKSDNLSLVSLVVYINIRMLVIMYKLNLSRCRISIGRIGICT